MPKKKKLSPSKKSAYIDTDQENRLLEAASEVKKESKQIDFKEKFDSAVAGEWAQIIKDIMAMANSGGGAILFGVNDDGEVVQGFDKTTILSIDTATIADKIYSYTNENFADVKIVEITRDGQSIPIFLIAEASIPIAFTKPGSDVLEKGKQRPAFAKGSVYFRHGAKSEPGNTNDIKQAFNRELNRTRKLWFEGVRKISNIKSGDEVIVKKVDMAQPKILQPMPSRIVSDSSAPTFRPDNAADLWPHRSKEVVKKINEGLTDGKKVSPHDLLCIKRMHNIDEKSKPDLVYKPYKDVSPRYSDNFAEWVFSSIKKNPHFFEEARTYYRDLKTKPQ